MNHSFGQEFLCRFLHLRFCPSFSSFCPFRAATFTTIGPIYSQPKQQKQLFLEVPILLVPNRSLASSASVGAFFDGGRRRGQSMPSPSVHFMTGRQRSIDEACRGLGWVFIMVGVTFAGLPLYRMFCESTGFGGTTNVAKALEQIEHMDTVSDRLIRVRFNADVNSSMQWKFKPVQNEIYVNPGETALAFFTAENPTDRPIVGISTYNLTPFQAAYYFNKIQCFCFDEQILRPGEKVDLPVFFYIDPEFANDPQLERIDDLMLSYTFFESKSNLVLPSPFDPTNRPMSKNGDSDVNNKGDLVQEKQRQLEKA